MRTSEKGMAPRNKPYSRDRHATAREANALPLVSVIVPFINAATFITEAIRSVLDQTYEHWELLLVDDGSTDGSTEIALGSAKQCPERVRYLEHEDHQNRGVSASRNLGIRHARGENIALLDADDVWLPQKLERQVAILNSHPEVAMVYGLDQWWFSWTGNPEHSLRDFVHELGVPPDTLIRPPELLDLFFFRQRASIPCPSNILMRREALEQVGGFEEDFRGRYGVYEDQAFLAKVSLKVPVFASGELWNRYRQHPSSACAVAKQTGQEYAARLFFLDWLAGYLSDQGFKDPEIWKNLGQELWRCRHPRLSQLLSSLPPSLSGMVGTVVQTALQVPPSRSRTC